jgi:hypothetical protein
MAWGRTANHCWTPHAHLGDASKTFYCRSGRVGICRELVLDKFRQTTNHAFADQPPDGMGPNRQSLLDPSPPRSGIGLHTGAVGKGRVMAYVSKWGLMSAVCEDVMTAAGLAKDEAQNGICQAVADGVVNIRVTLREHATRFMRSADVLDGKVFEIPTTLKPEDFDWDQSRPLKPWFVRREMYSLPGYWHVEKIELCITDVMNAFCTAARPGGPLERAESEAGPASRSRPALQTDGVGLESSSRRSPGADGSARRRGARPQKFEQTSGAMRDDLRQGRRTPAELKTMLEKNLAAAYGVSRDTARKARNAVLAEFGEN